MRKVSNRSNRSNQARPSNITSASVGVNDLAEMFDCSPRLIEDLAERGVVVRLAHGKYDPLASTRAYVRKLREQAAGRGGDGGAAASIKYKAAATDLLRLRLRRESGELVLVALVREQWGRIMRMIRQHVLSLPGRIAVDLQLSAHDRQVVERHCRDLLMDASLAKGLEISTEPADEAG
jgi:phage terminase Nu1 subunit (DNA packaging protein)